MKCKNGELQYRNFSNFYNLKIDPKCHLTCFRKSNLYLNLGAKTNFFLQFCARKFKFFSFHLNFSAIFYSMF